MGSSRGAGSALGAFQPPAACGTCWDQPQGPRAVPLRLALQVSAPHRGWLMPVVPLTGGDAWHHLVPRASPVHPRSPSSSPSLSRSRWGWKPSDLWLKPLLSCTLARVALGSLAWSKRGDGSMCWPFSNPVCPNLSLLFPKTRKCVQPSSAAFIVETNLK